jgi:hypothetical protein
MNFEYNIIILIFINVNDILIILYFTDIHLKTRRRQKLLTWLRKSFPAGRQVSDLTTVWRDGTILCDVIESVVPGSCTAQLRKRYSHRSIQHGQILATKHLYVQQVSAKWNCYMI